MKSNFYTWQTLSADGGEVSSSSMIPLRTESLEIGDAPDTIILCGGDSSHNYENKTLTSWLHQQSSLGSRIGAISDGAFVAAEAKLFDDCASTIHWKCHDAYRERFPTLDIRPSIMEISERRFSCAGGTSSLDLTLNFISADHGRDVAGLVAQNYFHDVIRDGKQEQHVINAYRLANRNPVLAEAMLLMESHLEARLTIADIASLLSISRRQLDRIFRRDLDCSPQEFYRQLRLNRASGLLLQTNMSVTEVALGCGFQSASHLGKFFRERFGVTPGIYRREQTHV